jgi:hypothetical protein
MTIRNKPRTHGTTSRHVMTSSVTPTHMWLANECLRGADLRPGMRFLDVAAGSPNTQLHWPPMDPPPLPFQLRDPGKLRQDWLKPLALGRSSGSLGCLNR